MMFDLIAETGAALVLVTHDEVLAGRADRVARMADGRMVGSMNRTEFLPPPCGEGRSARSDDRVGVCGSDGRLPTIHPDQPTLPHPDRFAVCPSPMRGGREL